MPKRKPRVISPCTAERCSMQDHTRIIEFSGATSNERGGLIEFRDLDEHMLVIPYVLGAEVRVNVKPDQLQLSPNDWRWLEQMIAKRPDSRLRLALQRLDECRRETARMSTEEAMHAYSKAIDDISTILRPLKGNTEGAA